jgi:outer membrane lipoprotein-sorting protein
VKGQLIAKKGNKYVLSLGNRKIICNGKDIWNYVPENKNVLLSNYETHGESASIEKILFQFTKNYKPVSLKKISQSGRSSSVFLELMPVKQDNDDISMIKLELNPETIEIFTIIIRRNYAEESWAISNLKLNPNIADNKFEFKTPENVEIIDLR